MNKEEIETNKVNSNRKKEIKKMILIQILLILLVILCYVFLNSKYINLVPKCHIKETYNLLCPSCGGTTAVKNLVNGNILEALKNNSIIILGIIYCGIVDTVYVINTIMGKERFRILFPHYNKYYHIIMFSIILAVYTIIRNILIHINI